MRCAVKFEWRSFKPRNHLIYAFRSHFIHSNSELIFFLLRETSFEWCISGSVSRTLVITIEMEFKQMYYYLCVIKGREKKTIWYKANEGMRANRYVFMHRLPKIKRKEEISMERHTGPKTCVCSNHSFLAGDAAFAFFFFFDASLLLLLSNKTFFQAII